MKSEQSKESIQALTLKLKDIQSPIHSRLMAAISFLNAGTENPEVISVLRESLKSGDQYDRVNAAYRLGRISKNEEQIPYLIEALSDGSLKVRASAASALGNMGPSAKSAVPELIKAMKYKNLYLRYVEAKDAWSKKFGVVNLGTSGIMYEWCASRNSAAGALKKIGSPEAIKAIEGYESKQPAQANPGADLYTRILNIFR